jgi:hypothetical protein
MVSQQLAPPTHGVVAVSEAQLGASLHDPFWQTSLHSLPKASQLPSTQRCGW